MVDLEVALTVKLPVSKGAAEKIKKAGGTVEEVINSNARKEVNQFYEFIEF